MQFIQVAAIEYVDQNLRQQDVEMAEDASTLEQQSLRDKFNVSTRRDGSSKLTLDNFEFIKVRYSATREACLYKAIAILLRSHQN